MNGQEIERVADQAMQWPDRVRALSVVDSEGFTKANGMAKVIVALRREIGSVFDPIIEKTKETKRAAEAARKEAEDRKAQTEAPLVEAEKILFPKIDAYLQEQKRIAAEEMARLEKENKAKAEEEQIQAAILAEDVGMDNVADAILEAPTVVQQIKVEVPKSDVITFREDWSAEVYDLRLFAKGIGTGEVPKNCWEPKMAVLNRLASAMQNKLSVPGVRAKMERIPIRRRQ